MRTKRLKRIFLPVILLFLLILFTVQTPAIITPWIDVPEETETGESGEVTDEPLNEEESTDGGKGSTEIESDFARDAEANTQREIEATSERSAEAAKKKGCGSMIPESGIWVISLTGITAIYFLMRKGKHNETAS